MIDAKQECKKCEDIDRWAFEKDFGNMFIMDFTKDEYNTKDVYMTAVTASRREYVGELKGYFKPDLPRSAEKFDDYQIDYTKLIEVKKKGLNQNRTPLIICYFTDRLVIWDLNKSKWENTARWVNSNVKGYDYGRKEKDLMGYLYFNDAVYNEPISAEEYRQKYNQERNHED